MKVASYGAPGRGTAIDADGRERRRSDATCGTTKTGKVGSNEKGGGRELRLSRESDGDGRGEKDNRRGRVRSERGAPQIRRGRRRVSREGGIRGRDGRDGRRGEVGAVRSHGSAATGKQTSEPPRGHAYSCAYVRAYVCACVCARVIAADRRGTLAPSRPSIITRGAHEGRRRARRGRGGRRVRRASVDDGLSCGPRLASSRLTSPRLAAPHLAPLRASVYVTNVCVCLRVKRGRGIL